MRARGGWRWCRWPRPAERRFVVATRPPPLVSAAARLLAAHLRAAAR
jgi:hypothetical protein